MTVFAGSDNIRDCWSPFGNGDMLDRAAIIAERHEMFTDPDLETAFALATAERTRRSATPAATPRRRGRRSHRGPAPSIADAVVDRPPRSLVLRGGRIAAEHGVASPALSRLSIT